MNGKLLAEWFWTDRWTGSSAFLLPMEVRGFYREMLTQAWRRGAQLPNDHEAIQRAIGATAKEWDRCWPKVSKFWRVDGGVIVNDTQLEIYREAEGRYTVTTERAKKGAQGRWKHSPSNTQAHAQVSTQAHAQASSQALPKHMPEQCTPSPSLSPISETVSNSDGVLTRANLDAWFCELKASYPTQAVTAGYRTETAWTEVFEHDPRPDETIWADIQANLANQKRGAQWAKGMIPTLESWLRDGKWQQQHEPAGPVAASTRTAGNVAALKAFAERKTTP